MVGTKTIVIWYYIVIFIVVIRGFSDLQCWFIAENDKVHSCYDQAAKLQLFTCIHEQLKITLVLECYALLIPDLQKSRVPAQI